MYDWVGYININYTTIKKNYKENKELEINGKI